MRGAKRSRHSNQARDQERALADYNTEKAARTASFVKQLENERIMGIHYHEWQRSNADLLKAFQKSGMQIASDRGFGPTYDPLDRIWELISYYEFRRTKYERAARYPWLPIAPDPPEPK